MAFLSRSFLPKPPCGGCSTVGAEYVASPPPQRQEDCYCYFMCMDSLLEYLSVNHVGGCLRALGPEDGVRSLGTEAWVLRIEPGSAEITARAPSWCTSFQSAVRLPRCPLDLRHFDCLGITQGSHAGPASQSCLCQCAAQQPSSLGPAPGCQLSVSPVQAVCVLPLAWTRSPDYSVA